MRKTKLSVARTGTSAQAKLSHKEIVEGMRALRKQVKPGNMSVKEIIEDGRRF